MKTIITEHTRTRLRNMRQGGIERSDIHTAAARIPGTIPVATRFRGFIAKSGRVFDLVVKDTIDGRLVITVIGK